MTSIPLLEICVDSLDSARAAARGGADRLEVCANLIIGGTTPSPALIAAIVRETELPVHALIRPRAGDFLYTQEECEQMCEEIKSLVKAGARGVVIGALNADGTLNAEQMRQMIEAAHGAHITLHRAFDMSCDLFAALEEAAALGVNTVLTSGGEESVDAGAGCLEKLVKASRARVNILAGGGVDAHAIDRLYPLGVRAFHLSGKKTVHSDMVYRNVRVHMGACGMSEYEYPRTDAKLVRAAKERLYVAYLRASMPMQDTLDVPEETLLCAVRATFDAAERLPFIKALTPELFYTYVLQMRVNDEKIDDARPVLLEALYPHVIGLCDEQAALEVNNWCARHVRYAASDGRTRGVRGILNACEGRCGEESVFVVNALRAVGIAARQVYALWWSHCDDNHAWVEVYARGRWHYIGACEPEEALDRGWFTSAASRAMLIHTRALGDVWKGDDTFYRRGCYMGINRTRAYALTRVLRIFVKDGAGAQVRFCLANAGRLRTLYVAWADENGCVSLETGVGGLYVSVRWPDGRVRARALDTGEKTEEVFSLEQPLQNSFYLRAPAQSRVGSEPPAVLCAACARDYEARRARLEKSACALAGEDSQLAELYAAARGNARELARFLQSGNTDTIDLRRAALLGLGCKDATDISTTTLQDALGAQVHHLRYDNEQLYPIYEAIRAYFDQRGEAPRLMAQVRAFLRAHVKEETYSGLDWPCRADAALREGRCAAGGHALLEKQIAAALQIEPEQEELRVNVTFENPAGLHPQEEFALVRLGQEDGSETPEDITIVDGENQVRVRPGHYVLFILSRQLDGSVYGHFDLFDMQTDCTLSLKPERDETRALLRREPLPALKAIGYAGENVTAFLAPGEEPTAHFLLELVQCGVPQEIRLLLFIRGGEKNALVRAAEELPNVRVESMDAPKEEALRALRGCMGVGDVRLPFVVALSEQGEGLYACGNYSVGSLRKLIHVLRAANS